VPNQTQVIAPNWSAGTWVLDDFRRGLVREPFEMGMPTMIDDLVQDITDARRRFRVLFSAPPFRAFKDESSGFAKYWTATGTVRRATDGGLAVPGLFHYFEDAPRELFVKAEPIEQ
jgi:hypothetical protein